MTKTPEIKSITVLFIDPFSASITKRTIRADRATGLYHQELYWLLSGGHEVNLKLKNGDSLLVNGSASRPTNIDGFEFLPFRRLIFGKGVLANGVYRFRSARTTPEELLTQIRFMRADELKARIERYRFLSQQRPD